MVVSKKQLLLKLVFSKDPYLNLYLSVMEKFSRRNSKYSLLEAGTSKDEISIIMNKKYLYENFPPPVFKTKNE